MAYRIRHIREPDWHSIVQLEAAAYGEAGLSEGRAALMSRGGSSPATSFVLDAGGEIVGYLLALPYPRFRFPDLRRAEESRFETSNLHLHDLVISDRCRGNGLARRLLGQLIGTARTLGYGRISLVAVAGSGPFWSGSGYQAEPGVPLPSGYGPDAMYMSTTI
ncbi:MAG: GNAT family N-acetyltransferase [Natronosporangium sp.]